ncbi:MAG: preprotein translocase subunit SecA, partial [Patescibacteria group bacterium]
MGIWSKLFKDANEKEIDKLLPTVDRINTFSAEFEKLAYDDLKNKTIELKSKLANGSSLDDLLPEAFALAREANRRAIGIRHYDVQLMGAMILHRGEISEMKTGEGKTHVASLALYLNALEGKGAHLITVNDYLAKRDAGWNGAANHLLGMTTSCLVHDVALIYDPNYNDDQQKDDRLKHLRPCTRKEAYSADITYGTNSEFGFDFLRDNMATRVELQVQRELNFAIVDEVDSVLIDEARTPLIISSPAEESAGLYKKFSQLVPRLQENTDYNVDEKMRAATLTDEGIEKIEKWLGCGNIYTEGGMQLAHHLEQALNAHALYKNDRDYVVKDGEVIIIDEFTGRLMYGRRYSEGLHQAIEAKENVEVQKESRTLATITIQNYFRMYKKLAGMTGTAATEAEEFSKI